LALGDVIYIFWFYLGDWVGGGGRIVAASEMLRPSLAHFQQAEVMPRGFKTCCACVNVSV